MTISVAELVPRRFPLQRRLEPTGFVYRVTSLDQLSIEAELFINRLCGPLNVVQLM